MDKKRHHYLAQTYLRRFCNEDGKICTYSKDKGGDYWFSTPESIAFENYYYSQPRPDGGRDNNRLEDFFAKYEAKWGPLVAKIERREATSDGLTHLLSFILMHRVRVPSARNVIEKALAEAVRMNGHFLHDRGKLPPPPPGLTYEYLDRHISIAVDPHRSIHAMAAVAKGVIRIFDALGFEILENETTADFISSDNPVVYFDPTVAEHALEPYQIDRHRMEIELLFPITPRFLLWGHTILKDQFNRHGVLYRTTRSEEFVSRANRFIVRFADRFVFARAEGYRSLVRKYAHRSPVLSVTHIRTQAGRGIIGRLVFGKREPKPRWTRRTTDS